MNSEQEILKTFTCFFFESASCSKVADVELPVNRPTSKCKNRVNEALLEGGFLPDSSAIQLYKVSSISNSHLILAVLKSTSAFAASQNRYYYEGSVATKH